MSVILGQLKKLVDLDLEITNEEEKELNVLKDGVLSYLELNEGYRGKILQRHSEDWYRFIRLLSTLATYQFDLFASYLMVYHPIFSQNNSFRNFLVFNNNMIISQLKRKFYKENPGGVLEVKDKNVNHLRLYWLGKEIIFAKKENSKLKAILYEFYLYLLSSLTFFYIPSSKKGLFADFSFNNRHFFDYFSGILLERLSSLSDKANEEEIEKFILELTPFYLFHFLKFYKNNKEEFNKRRTPEIYSAVVEFLTNGVKNGTRYYLEPLIFNFSLKLRKIWEIYKELKFNYNQQIPEFLKGILNYIKDNLELMDKFYKTYSSFKIHPNKIYSVLFDKDTQIIDKLYEIFNSVGLKENDIERVGILDI